MCEALSIMTNFYMLWVAHDFCKAARCRCSNDDADLVPHSFLTHFLCVLRPDVRCGRFPKIGIRFRGCPFHMTTEITGFFPFSSTSHSKKYRCKSKLSARNNSIQPTEAEPGAHRDSRIRCLDPGLTLTQSRDGAKRFAKLASEVFRKPIRLHSTNHPCKMDRADVVQILMDADSNPSIMAGEGIFRFSQSGSSSLKSHQFQLSTIFTLPLSSHLCFFRRSNYSSSRTRARTIFIELNA